MRKIALIAFNCSPYRGSEYSVSWNFIVNMSQSNELFVFYGKDCPGEFGNCKDIDEWLKTNSLPNVHFIKVEVDNRILIKLLQFTRKFLYYQIPFYIQYKMWHRKVFRLINAQKENFDLIHYLNPIGFKEPGYSWKVDLPYVWGPVQTVSVYPKALSRCLSLAGGGRLL